MEELLERSKNLKFKSRCFATKLSKDGAFYLSEVKRGLEAGEPIVYERVKEILHEVFKVQIGASVVKNHLRGECQCPKTKK
jgi:hypothetical protein